MSGDPRYVFDTNALVSASLFERSMTCDAFIIAGARGIFLQSQATAEELTNVLLRPKFDRYLSRSRREEFLYAFFAKAEYVEPIEQVRDCRDPDDDKFLELAVAGPAACIVSGDQDLLVLHPFRGIPIVTPAQFIATLDKPAG